MLIKMSFSQDDVAKLAIEALEKKFAVSIGDKYLVESDGSIVLADEACANIAKKLYAPAKTKVKKKALPNNNV